MKTIICALCLVLAVSVGNAQKSSNSKVSISYSSDEPGDKNYKVNISISNNDDLYTLNASFPNSKTEKLKRFLNDHLDAKMTKKGNTYQWDYLNEGEIGYNVKLKKGKLNVFMDKEYVSIDLVEDFIDMFSDLKEIVKE
ncbi:hypothetical protein [Aquimarina sp. MMG016]|uniref:hypothetical protein n=1 Tax=Aquimarina sp. MMG016 TaxID=2822690 RepID=UPI001B39E07C|nr:hypothetical protein [Aquimarina sp. MMG016]MBQ4822502.1 hypothetical protein [Aquimarina sp. MMG016]